MAHNCIDWTATPPARKLPFLILTCGNDHVYTVVPEKLKTLEHVARREFDLVDADIHFSSACANLCNGRPARITEDVWEHMRSLIGCVTVEVSGGAMDMQGALPGGSGSTKRKLSLDAGDEDENERPDNEPNDKPNSPVAQWEQDIPSDHGNDRDDNVSAPENQGEQPLEEELSVPVPRRLRKLRRVVSEDEEHESDESGQECQAPTRSQASSLATSPPKPSQPSKEIKKERYGYELSQQNPDSSEPLPETSKPIRQEKGVAEGGSVSRPNSQDDSEATYTESYPLVETQPQADATHTAKLMIRVAHRLSKQESKFTTKGTTKVSKVLAGVCKSFRLDVDNATLYLIVSTEEDGEEENLFPCDRNDSISRAGAERDTESRFVLKMAGEE